MITRAKKYIVTAHANTGSGEEFRISNTEKGAEEMAQKSNGKYEAATLCQITCDVCEGVYEWGEGWEYCREEHLQDVLKEMEETTEGTGWKTIKGAHFCDACAGGMTALELLAEYITAARLTGEPEKHISPFEQHLNPKKTVDFLNSLMAIDKEAIARLLWNRVPCNQALADHPTVQVVSEVTTKGKTTTVGLLGILNGLFGVDKDGYGPITAHFDAAGTLERFGLTPANKNEPDYAVAFKLQPGKTATDEPPLYAGDDPCEGCNVSKTGDCAPTAAGCPGEAKA